MKPTKILILYSEIAGYTLSCLETLVHVHPNVEVHLVRWPVNAEAPFAFDFGDSLKQYLRTDFKDDSLLELSKGISPDLILCSGWIDKAYLAVCKHWRDQIPVVLTMDNKWTGSLKQQIACMFSAMLVRKYFNACWVPGEQQKVFALKLGFVNAQIRIGFYSCDLASYNMVYSSSHSLKMKTYPKAFIYAGRFYNFKGVNELWEAFRLFRQENTQWKLVCIGNGDQAPPTVDGLECMKFMQPEELRVLMERTGVFIMPSKVEPWGVVAHEFAAAGFPLLLSNAVGSSTAFLRNNINGFSFEAGSVIEILSAMRKVATLTKEQLVQMGVESHALAQQISPAQWSSVLMSFLPKS